jgi:CHAT domain-containing protein/tetratricopeptide (TPR) repeat protein
MLNYQLRVRGTTRSARGWILVLPLVLMAAVPAWSQTALKKQATKNQQAPSVLAAKAYAEATELLAQSKPELAARRYQEAASHWNVAGDPIGEAKALRGYAESLQFACDIQQSAKGYERSLSLSRAAADSDGERKSLASLCFLHAALGYNDRALDECARSLDLATKANDLRSEAEALNGFGEIYYSRDELQKALDSHRRANAIWERLGDKRGQARSLRYIGFAYAVLRDHPKALDAYRQSLALWRAADDTRNQIGSVVGMGFLYGRIGETQESLNLFYQAVTLNKATRCRSIEGQLFSGLAHLYNDLGEQQKSLLYYEQAFSAYKAQEDNWGQGAIKLEMGMIYYSIGKDDQALKNYQEAFQAYQRVGRRSAMSIVLREIGRVYDKRGDDTSALDYYNQSLAMASANEEPYDAAYTHNYIARIYERKGDKQKALEYCKEALKLNREVQDPYGQAMILVSLARIHKQLNELETARTYIEEALRLSEASRAKLDSQDLRATYFASVREQFELYTELLMLLHEKLPSRGFDVVAFEVSERARARSLLESLSESKIDLTQGVDEALLKSERELEQQMNARTERRIQLLASNASPAAVAAFDKQFETLTLQYKQVQGQIRASSPGYKALAQPLPLTAAAIQRDVLDSQTVLLEYLLGEERSWLWVVTTNSLKAFPLPPRDEIESEVRRVYGSLTERNRTIPDETIKQRTDRFAAADVEYKRSAEKLSRMILSPAAGELRAKRLVIVADGALHYIPFAALPDPSASLATAQKQPLPLIVNHEIVSLASASALAQMRDQIRERPKAPKTVAVIADPVFNKVDARVESSVSGRRRKPANEKPGIESDLLAHRALRSFAESGGQPFDRLPFSRREGKAIFDMTPKGQGTLVMDFDANRASITSGSLAQYRIVHLATHGILNSDNPEFSGIVLSLVNQKGQEQAGFVDLSEIYNLKLSAELVVLSACQTALGREIKGEGLIGLTRGFMHAGAPRVVASLWQVDDAATANLMREFYKAMLVEGMRPAEALRAAQTRTWTNDQELSPYYWAAFTLQGEWR